MPESDAAFGEIVRRKFHGYAVARQHADSVPPQPACQMREHHPFMFQLHAEQPAGELLKNRAGHFDAVFFTQSKSFFVPA